MGFSNEIIEAVWGKGQIISGYGSGKFRKDQCDAWIKRSEYGDDQRQSIYGWEVDHINPDGGDEISNLRPLQWKNNASRQDGKLTCPVTSNGDKNIDSSQ